jgi:hypothetical protein
MISLFTGNNFATTGNNAMSRPFGGAASCRPIVRTGNKKKTLTISQLLPRPTQLLQPRLPSARRRRRLVCVANEPCSRRATRRQVHSHSSILPLSGRKTRLLSVPGRCPSPLPPPTATTTTATYLIGLRSGRRPSGQLRMSPATARASDGGAR